MAKLKTQDVASYTMEIFDTPDEPIKTIWESSSPHKAFEKFKELVKRAIVAKYGRYMLSTLSNQFIGYSAHYIYAYCVTKYGIIKKMKCEEIIWEGKTYPIANIVIFEDTPAEEVITIASTDLNDELCDGMLNSNPAAFELDE